jgi:Ca2+-binding EF-hand superfamily protein
LEKAKQIAADLKKKQLLQVDHGHDDELRYETLLDKYERADAELKEMQEKYGVLETTQNRRLNSSKAAQEVIAQFSTQIMEEIASRQQDGDTVDLNAIFESFDTDGDGTLSQKELMVGLREFGIKLSKDERKKLLDILDADGDGTIDWQEFAGVIQQMQDNAMHELERHKLEDDKKELADKHQLMVDQLSKLEDESLGHASQVQNRKMNSSKAAQEVASQFNRQILEEVQRRQKDGDDVDIKTVFESFDTDGNGVLTRKELVVGLREFGIKMSKDEKEKLLEILDEVRNFAFVHALAE